MNRFKFFFGVFFLLGSALCSEELSEFKFPLQAVQKTEIKNDTLYVYVQKTKSVNKAPDTSDENKRIEMIEQVSKAPFLSSKDSVPVVDAVPAILKKKSPRKKTRITTYTTVFLVSGLVFGVYGLEQLNAASHLESRVDRYNSENESKSLSELKRDMDGVKTSRNLSLGLSGICFALTLLSFDF